MQFLIADTFTDSLIRFTAQEQKAVKTTAFDLQMNPASPGLQYHKLERSQDPNFSSVKVSRDIRIIVHRTGSSFMLCYVGHHDDAYAWAGRRKLETHPSTGAAQIVEVRERVEEIVIPTYVVEEHPKPLLFSNFTDEELLKYGVPEEWLADVKAANEDSLLILADHLPREAGEALLELATGGQPIIPAIIVPAEDPFAHPDAQRRFRVMENVEELKIALDYPWEKWAIFLHPDQKKFVQANYDGPARISGSAGTGKTVVALHRAAYLAKTNPGARILLTTFSNPLAGMLAEKLRLLIQDQPHLAEQIEVISINEIASRLFSINLGQIQPADKKEIRRIISEVSTNFENSGFSLNFLFNEWDQVVDAWQLSDWESYRDVLRLGRKTRLPESRRQLIWSIFEKVRSELKDKKLFTYSEMFTELSKYYSINHKSPFDYLVVDEAQDLSVSQLKFLASLGQNQPNSLFFTGDLGQRIFQSPFSWRSLGVDIRGRSRTLHVNYRTSHQIRSQADKLLGPEITDVDGITDKREGTISVFNGPDPLIKSFSDQDDEINEVSKWISSQINTGFKPEEIGVFVRSDSEIPRAISAIVNSGVPYNLLDEKEYSSIGYISLCTMHLAKGLEFRSVVIMACDDEVIPSQERIEEVTDESDLEEVYNTERHLLYVACTRARDYLLITGVTPASEFLDDLTM